MEIKQKKSPVLLIVAFVVLFGVGLGFGFYFSQVNASESKLGNIDREIVQAQIALDDLKQSDIVLAQRGTTALNEIRKTEIKWSEILSTLTVIAPTEPELRRKIVDFLSYSGSEDGRLTFNVQTLTSENTKAQFGYVAKIIEVFNEATDFKNAFVPSISKSQNSEGQTSLSFLLSTQYMPSSTYEVAEEDAETVPRR